MKQSSFDRLVTATREQVVVQLSHLDSPGHSTLYGFMSYSRVTGDIKVSWCFECPLSLAVRLKETLRFIHLCRSL